jgi:hypothetical protein
MQIESRSCLGKHRQNAFGKPFSHRRQRADVLEAADSDHRAAHGIENRLWVAAVAGKAARVPRADNRKMLKRRRAAPPIDEPLRVSISVVA